MCKDAERAKCAILVYEGADATVAFIHCCLGSIRELKEDLRVP